ncbi:penicillin-binding protein [Bacillus coahuilensis m2-6]|nr:PBP1A family penicillin-binding protein [Bacillus coahuilensis]KUP04961.1 penicillin-binding protein [Bacillus coahuilensis m2-6]
MEIMPNFKGMNFSKTLKWLRALVILSIIVGLLLSITVLGILTYAKIQGAPTLAVPQSNLYYSSDGKIFGETHNGEKRYWVNLEDISPALIDATISVEDKKFYDHLGFDLKRIAGAAVADIKAMSKVQGASTITQQYARNLYLTHDKTWSRKLSEAMYSIRLELFYSKNDILEGYLNTIYYGHGAYGVEAASQYYFGKSASELTLGEATILAGIPKAPSSYSPVADLEKSTTRQTVVLDEMIEDGKITESQKSTALAEKPVIIGKHNLEVTQTAPYFQDRVHYILQNQLGMTDRQIELGGLRIHTTLNVKHQEAAERLVKELIVNEGSKLQVALTSMDPETGYVTAMVGGTDYVKSPFNRATQAIRQPGSTIKPLLYYAALESGFDPATTMKSELTSFRYNDGEDVYAPHNFNNRYSNDEITLAQAIGISDNVFAVKTHFFLGFDALIDAGKQFGLSTPIGSEPSAPLGTSEVRVIDMVKAYSMFANGGRDIAPVFITKIEDPNGTILYEYENEGVQVLDPDQAFVMTDMLTGTFDPALNDHSSVTGSSVLDSVTRPYAAKTGSTLWDRWMIGYSPQLVSGVWTGYDDNSEMTLAYDNTVAKELWVGFMEAALEDEEVAEFVPTENVIKVEVDPHTGKVATKDCPVTREMYFVAGTEPTEFCQTHIGEDRSIRDLLPGKKNDGDSGSDSGKSLFDRVVDWIF